MPTGPPPPARATTLPTPLPTEDPAPTENLAPTEGQVPSEVPGPASLPVAEISTPAGSVVGKLGSYTLDGRGSDAPWQPFATVPSVTLVAGETLTTRFADGAAIGDWSAVIAAADDTTGSGQRSVSGTGIAGPGPGQTVGIGPFPIGQWVLQVRLFRADGRGEGLTYWAVSVR